MGYNTKFEGEFRLDRPLDDDTYYGLEGLDGPFYESEGMPSQWCQWKVGTDWQSIVWDGGEKFYGYIGWIRHINDKFLRPQNYVLNGVVAFQGEELKDSGRIVATDGKIEVFWNYDDPKLSNYDPKSKCWCHIPEGQGVCWISEDRKVFCDVEDMQGVDSEEEYAMEQLMVGITIGNPKAIAILIDVSAPAGTDKPIDICSKHPELERARRMSIDAAMPLIDGERGARARLMQLVRATIRKSKERMKNSTWNRGK